MSEETQQTQQTEQPNVSIGDIMILKQVVEVATARGALRANELSQVGVVYDRVNAWLDSVMPPEEVTTSEDEDNQGEADA